MKKILKVNFGKKGDNEYKYVIIYQEEDSEGYTFTNSRTVKSKTYLPFSDMVGKELDVVLAKLEESEDTVNADNPFKNC